MTKARTKLLLIAETLSAGVRTHVVDLVLNLDVKQFDIYLMYSPKRCDQAFIDNIPEMKKRASLIESQHLQRAISFEDVNSFFEICKVIKHLRPDIVHCHSSKAGFSGRLAAKMCGVKKIFYTPHAYFFQNPDVSVKQSIFFVLAECFLSRLCTTTTFNVSEGERCCAIEHKVDKPSKFKVIYNGLPDVELPGKSDARKLLGIPNNSFVVGNVARFFKQKDPYTFIDIAKSVLQKKEDAHFVMIGDGPLYETCLALVKDEPRIHLVGYRSDANTVITAFDLYLNTSLYEGLPYSLVESLRAGIPVICTKVTGNMEVISEGITGSFFAPREIFAAVDKILTYQKSTFLKNTCQNEFREKFALRRMVQNISQSYLEAIHV